MLVGFLLLAVGEFAHDQVVSEFGSDIYFKLMLWCVRVATMFTISVSFVMSIEKGSKVTGIFFDNLLTLLIYRKKIKTLELRSDKLLTRIRSISDR